ncbi:MAG: hypothetical protein L0Z55_07115 [Planctomycetes bacterium]|nr:hypothetical protein [Planctomycetota bacterium]
MRIRTLSLAMFLVAIIASLALAARLPGPIVYTGVVDAGASARFLQPMAAGESTKMDLETASRARLELYLVDPNGAVVAHGVRNGLHVNLRYSAQEAGQYSVFVRNPSTMPTPFRLTIY